MIDLRSDTVTKPTIGMREAIARAEVGDDVLDADPTTAALERRVAELLNKEAAAFFPSGIMANETALQLLSPAGTEVIVEAHSHLVDWELGAPAAWAGVQLRPVATADGLLTADLVERAVRPPMKLQLRTSAIALENTHSASGGKVMPLDRTRAIIEVARRYELPVHLDGCRIWHATAACGHSEAEFAEGADTVMVTLSKGLGCPVGSLLAGSTELMDQARWIRRRMGGAMRQSGVLAAAGLYALEHHRSRLAEDHARAKRLAEGVGLIPNLNVVPPETNIVMIDLMKPGLDSFQVVRALRERGILLVEITTRRIRAVTHLDIDDHHIDQTIAGLRALFA